MPVSLACLGTLPVRESLNAQKRRQAAAVANCEHARMCAHTHTRSHPPSSPPPPALPLSQREVHDDDLDLVSGGTH